MSGVCEVIGVVSGVAAVISAFHNGAAMIERIKEHRAARRALQPPQLLKISVDEAIEEIQREKTKVVRRFGEDEVERGDRDALLELQEIIIVLQNTFIEGLLQDGSENEETDFTGLIAVVEAGRDSTITALMGLRQRMLRNAGVTAMSSLMLRQLPRADLARQDRRPVALPPAAGTVEAVPQTRRDSAATNTLQSHRASWGSVAASSRASYVGTSRSSIGSCSPMDLAHYPGSRSTVNSRIGSLLEQVSQDELRVSNSSSERPDAEYNAIPRPTKDNNYLGFCKTAAKLQNGEKGISVARDYLAYTTQSSVSAAVCRELNCAFRQICDRDTIWKQVYTDDTKGLKYRWSFLAKSHVPAKIAPPTSEHPYLYQCMFCTYSGYARKHFTEGAYLDHISLEHRGTPINSVVLYKTFCISDHECKDNEEFDINLFPLRPREQDKRRRLKMRDSFMHGPTLMDDLRGYMSSRLSLVNDSTSVNSIDEHGVPEMRGALPESETEEEIAVRQRTEPDPDRTFPEKSVSRGNVLAAEAGRYHNLESKDLSSREERKGKRSHATKEKKPRK